MNFTSQQTVPTSTNETPDSQLVAAALAGDVESLGTLYTRHYRAVVGIAYCVSGNHQSAEDAAQEAFAVACRDLWRLKDHGKFASWVCGIARKIAIHTAKRLRRQKLQPDLSHTPARENNNERLELLRRTVAELPDSAKEVIVLHYDSGLSHQQVAAALNISPAAVHGRLIRARRKISEEIRKNDESGEQHE